MRVVRSSLPSLQPVSIAGHDADADADATHSSSCSSFLSVKSHVFLHSVCGLSDTYIALDKPSRT